MHYFTREFLALAADHVRSEGVYHIAKKKIPSRDGPVQVRQSLKAHSLTSVLPSCISATLLLIGPPHKSTGCTRSFCCALLYQCEDTACQALRGARGTSRTSTAWALNDDGGSKTMSMFWTVQGIKLELFIFDTFPLAERVALLEVHRHEEFAPVKNAPGSATDSPDTARQAILKLHTKCVPIQTGIELSASHTPWH